ncbi:MAG: UbiA family prenyltransferase [Acidobacteriota bacterium]
MLFLRAILRLIRFSTSLLCVLAIFLPLLARTKNLVLSISEAFPLFFICMCTFIANDLDDIERDRVNHPDRPLPAGHLSKEFAAILYFVSLGSALFSTRYFVPPEIAFWYYGLITLTISYRYVVAFLPSAKTVYTAIGSSIPLLLIATAYPHEQKLRIAAASVFLFILAREICGDLQDRAGDAASFMHRFSPSSLAFTAFVLQVLGLVLLAFQTTNRGDAIALTSMTLLLTLSIVYWFKLARYRRATLLMKIQLFVGLYFLI